MTWIKTVPVEKASGRLEKLYSRIKAPDGSVDNIMQAHSLRPHSMEGHMALYKAVLHHSGNEIPKSFLETLGVYVSLLNGCAHCAEHHFAGLTRLLGDSAHANLVRAALEADRPNADVFEAKEATALVYARALTRTPVDMAQENVSALRDAGWSDGEILEINQVVAYFSYANRTVLGLGCSHEGEVLGLSPGNSKDAADWGHR